MQEIGVYIRLRNVDSATLVSREDHGWLGQWSWRVDGNGYVFRDNLGERRSMQREILSAPDGVEVDHINHDVLDNRRSNLRLASHRQNSHNRLKARSKTGYFGVSERDGRYRAKILVDRQAIHLGVFGSAFEAAMAFDSAAVFLRGNFAATNFPIWKVTPRDPVEIRKENSVRDIVVPDSFLRKVFLPVQERDKDNPPVAREIRKPAVRSSTGYLGVWKKRDSYCASIYKGRKYNLGTFPDAISAARAYDAVARFFIGQGNDFGLNFPSDETIPLDPESARPATAVMGVSKYIGVSPAKGRWDARVKKSGVVTTLGCWDTEIEAAMAYDSGASIIHGDKSRLNFPEQSPLFHSVEDIRDAAARRKRPSNA